MPYIPLYKEVERIKGVNAPDIYCMEYKKCNYKFKNGKNKGSFCNCNGFTSKYGILCNKHYNNCIRLEEKKLQQNTISNIESNIEPDIESNIAYNINIKLVEKIKDKWNNEMKQFSKTHTIPKIKELLKEKNLKLSGNKSELIMRLFK